MGCSQEFRLLGHTVVTDQTKVNCLLQIVFRNKICMETDTLRAQYLNCTVTYCNTGRYLFHPSDNNYLLQVSGLGIDVVIMTLQSSPSSDIAQIIVFQLLAFQIHSALFPLLPMPNNFQHKVYAEMYYECNLYFSYGLNQWSINTCSCQCQVCS